MLQEVSLRRKGALKRLAGAFGEYSKIGRAAGMRFLTEEERSASADFGHLPERVIVLPNGIELDLGGSVSGGAFKTRYRELVEKKVILFVGRLHWSKGLDTQLDAFTELTHARDDLVWVLIGPDEGEWERISTEASRRGLGSSLFWLGSQPRAACLEAMRDCDLVWMTSRHEAHSMVMNEALVLGAPLVITESVGFPSLGDAGAALVVSGDAKAIAAAVTRVLDERDLASDLRQRGPRFAREMLGWPRIAGSMLSFYEELILSRASSGAS
jgi:glycosyltransferase involved in cell wall biosynthesis